MNRMSRSLIIVLGALALCAALFLGARQAARDVFVTGRANPTDDLDWLRQEFHLDGAEMARIRQLHEGYLPRCAEMCDKIAAKQRELAEATADATNLSAVAAQKLSELAALRGQCQAQMLQHFFVVSQAMPPDQGRRYLEEMKRITLGLHEQIEQSMSPHGGNPHGHE